MHYNKCIISKSQCLMTFSKPDRQKINPTWKGLISHLMASCQATFLYTTHDLVKLAPARQQTLRLRKQQQYRIHIHIMYRARSRREARKTGATRARPDVYPKTIPALRGVIQKSSIAPKTKSWIGLLIGKSFGGDWSSLCIGAGMRRRAWLLPKPKRYIDELSRWGHQFMYGSPTSRPAVEKRRDHRLRAAG